MNAMTKRERVAAALRGEPTDRPAWSLWRHFYAAESTADQLAESMLSWVRQYPFDFLKVNPRAQYHVEPWGARYRYSGREHERPERLDYPIKTADDWERLEPRGLDAPALAEQLEALRKIGAGLRGRPAAVHHGLDAIARTFAPFAEACLEAGADGIFFATTRWASRDYLTPAEYAEFGRPYDLRVLDAVRGAEFNILHVCDSHNMLLDLADYPVQAFNWAATDPTNPTISQAARLPGLRIGGLSAEALTSSDPAQARQEAEAARAQAGDRGWALGPSCSIPTTSQDENIRAAAGTIGVDVY
jgi:uroporphyrinogen decarboxylase